MENQKLHQAIQDYHGGTTDYELYWELAFSPPADIEEVVRQSWQLINEPPHLPVPFIALACRLCLETSDHPQRVRESLDFLWVHSNYADDANLKIVAQRLNLSLEAIHLDER